MAVGHTPFYRAKTLDELRTMVLVQKRIVYPYWMPKVICDILVGLLQWKPEERTPLSLLKMYLTVLSMRDL